MALCTGNPAGCVYIFFMKSELIIPTGVGPINLADVAKIAKETGSVSPPQLVRSLHFDLPKAELALAELAAYGFLELSPQSGLVRTYNVTRNAYERIEAGRRRSIFSGIFENHVVSGTQG
jgi:hypothetical protein